MPVTGVEVNPLTFEEALQNKARYEQRTKHIKAPIRFEHGLAQHYQVEPADNHFYFFNPFPATTFREVVDNILQSVEENPRPVTIILFYPMPQYTRILLEDTPFKLMAEIKVPKAQDSLDKFLIYTWDLVSPTIACCQRSLRTQITFVTIRTTRKSSFFIIISRTSIIYESQFF